MSGSVSSIIQPIVQPTNPLTTMQGWQGLQNQQTQNRLMQQETANQVIAGQQAQTNLATQRMNRQAQVTYGLMNLSDDELKGGQPVRDALSQEHQAGTIDDNTYGVALDSLPPSTQPDGTPTPASAFRKVLNSHMIATLGGPDAVKMVIGTPVTINQGGQIQPGMQAGPLSPTQGAFTPSGPAVPLGLSPGEAAQRVPGPPNKDGSPTSVPLGSITPPNFAGVRPLPLPPAAPGAQTGAQTGGQTGAPTVAPTGAQTGAQTGGQTGGGAQIAGGAQVAAPPPAIPGQITTGTAPGFAQSQEATAQENTRQASALIASGQQRPTRMAMLNDMDTQSNVSGAFTGPDTGRYQTWIARLAQMGVQVPQGVPAQEQLAKMMANYQTMQAQNMGGLNTNEGLQQSIASTPHMAMTRQGLKAVVHQLQGSEDAQDAMTRAYQTDLANGTASPQNFAQWQSNFTKKTPDGQFDPRAFWFARMTPSERRTFFSATPDRADLKKNFTFAVKQGWIQQPDQPATAAQTP